MDAVFTYQLFFIFSLICSNCAIFQVTVELNETNWSEANKTCILGEGTLPSGQEEENFKQIISAMRHGGIKEAWISLRKKRLPIWTWLDGKPVDAEFARQPWGEVLNCGVLHLRDALLEVDKCSRKNFGYLCELKAGYGCSLVDDLMVKCIEWNGRAFLYSCLGKNWYQARYVCRKHKMDLPIIRNKDGKSFGTKWALDEPSHLGDCALLVVNKENITSWKTEYCHKKHKFMCIHRHGHGPQVSENLTSYVPEIITTDLPYSPSNDANGAPDPSSTSTYADGTIKLVYIVVPIGVAFLIAIILLLLFLRRHRTSKKKDKNRKPNGKEMSSLLDKDYNYKENKPVDEIIYDEDIHMKGKFRQNTFDELCVDKPLELTIKGNGEKQISHDSSEIVIIQEKAVNADIVLIVGKIYADMNRKNHKVDKTFQMVTPVVSIEKLFHPVKMQIPHNFGETGAGIKLFYKEKDADEWQHREGNKNGRMIDFNMQRPGKYVCLADGSEKRDTEMSVYLFFYELRENGDKQTLYFYTYAIANVHATTACLQGLHLRHPMASPDVYLEKAMRKLPFELPKTYIRGCEIHLNFVCDNTLWKVDGPQQKSSEYKISAHDIKPDWKKDAGLPMAQYRVQSKNKDVHKFFDVELQMTVVKPSDKDKSTGDRQIYTDNFNLTEVNALEPPGYENSPSGGKSLFGN